MYRPITYNFKFCTSMLETKFLEKHPNSYYVVYRSGNLEAHRDVSIQIIFISDLSFTQL